MVSKKVITPKEEEKSRIFPIGAQIAPGEIGFLQVDGIQDVLMARYNLLGQFGELGKEISFLTYEEIVNARIELMKRMLGYCCQESPQLIQEYAKSIDPLLKSRSEYLWQSHNVSAAALISLGDGAHVKLSPNFLNLEESHDTNFISTPGGSQVGGIIHPRDPRKTGKLEEFIKAIPGAIINLDQEKVETEYSCPEDLARNKIMMALMGGNSSVVVEYLNIRDHLFKNLKIDPRFNKFYSLGTRPFDIPELTTRGYFNPLVLDEQAKHMFYGFIPYSCLEKDPKNYLPFKCKKTLKIKNAS